MKKISKFFIGHKYMIVFYFVIVIAQFIGNGDSFPSDELTISYTFHVVDFKLGIVSRVLPGQIYLLLFKNPSMKSFVIYEWFLMTIIFLIGSFLLEKLYLSASERHKNAYAFIIVLFCISGVVFHMHFTFVGMFDVYWLYASIVFLLLLQSKKLWFLIPLQYVFMMFVNFGALLNYIPLMSIILLYEASNAEKKEEKKHLLIVFFISVAFTIATFAVLSYNETNNLHYSREQLHEILKSRGTTFYVYYDSYLYDDTIFRFLGKETVFRNVVFLKSEAIPAFIRSFINTIVTQFDKIIEVYFRTKVLESNTDYVLRIVACVLSGVPALIFFNRCYRRLFKSTKDKLKRFAVFCAIMLFPFAFFASVMFSTDVTRFYSNSFICTFVCFLYLLYKEKYTVGNILYGLCVKSDKSLLLLYFVISFISRFCPFTGVK